MLISRRYCRVSVIDWGSFRRAWPGESGIPYLEHWVFNLSNSLLLLLLLLLCTRNMNSIKIKVGGIDRGTWKNSEPCSGEGGCKFWVISSYLLLK